MTSERPTSRNRIVAAWTVGGLAVLLVGALVVAFVAGEDLFGSDRGTIDSYNRDVLESCDLPADSDLIQTSIRQVVDEQDRNYRSMWFVYASPLPADDVAEFFGTTQGRSMLISSARACEFGQRPSVLVLPLASAGERPSTPTETGGDSPAVYDGLWADDAAEVETNADVPPGTESLFRLRVAQREVDGIS